jgi:uncharacterized protein (TIGR01777 family)
MHVFLTGATGLIGNALLRQLLARGHVVTALSRTAAPRLVPGVKLIQGDPAAAGPWEDALAACDACIHLAGEPVAAGRWNEARKRAIRESRVASTARIAEVLAARGPTVLVSGSAVGFYGSRGDEVLDEASSPGSGFLADVCVAWEAAARPAEARARVVLLRTGIVLAREGGALPRMLLPFKLFAGGPLGSGEFWQAWIHLADEVGLILWALEQGAVRGPLNLTAPEPALQRDLARAIGRALGRPSALPMPAPALKLALGELATVVLASQRVVPRKAQDLGYAFRFPALQPALDDLLRRR